MGASADSDAADRRHARGLRASMHWSCMPAAPPTQFLDDQAYPYKVNPHFKSWVPIVDNPQCLLVYVPGARPRVLFHQPNDYWHQPARMPHEPWRDAVDLTPMADPAKAEVALDRPRTSRLHRAARLLPTRPRRAGAPSLNDADLLARLHYDRAVKTATSSNACDVQARWGPGTPGSARGISPRRIRIRRPHALFGGMRPARRGDAVQQYRRL